MSNFVLHIRPGMWLIEDYGICKGPVGLSYNKATQCWSLSKKVFKEELTHRKFYDAAHGHNPYKSFAAALEHAVEGRCLRKLEQEERINKERRLSTCGVSYYRQKNGVHRFGVSNPLGGGTTVYIGNDDNYAQNLDEAFERAADLRLQFERDHAVKSYWSAQSCRMSCGV